jgi:hypothetical protein
MPIVDCSYRLSCNAVWLPLQIVPNAASECELLHIMATGLKILCPERADGVEVHRKEPVDRWILPLPRNSLPKPTQQPAWI